MATDPGDLAADSAPEDADGIGEVPAEDRADFKMLRQAAEDQPWLFPSDQLEVTPKPPLKYDELLVPAGGITQYKKGVAALHSVPVSGQHTLNSRRLMDAIVALVQIHFRKMPKAQRDLAREMKASPLFYVTKGELRKMAGIASKDFGRVEEALDNLHEMKINWNVLGELAEVEWKMTSRFLASYGVGVGRFEGQVCFSVDPRVMDLILEPRLWVTLVLDIQQQLKTETSYALYQNTWRYIRTHNQVTADLKVETWIELLMGRSRYVQLDEKTGVQLVVDYSEWKARHLKPAIERVNNIAALGHTLELIEKKSGLKVRRLQFKFVPKAQEKLDLPMTWPDPIIDSLKSLGFAEDELVDLAQGASLDEVVDSLARFRRAEESKRAKGQRITAAKAFFNGILNNVISQKEVDDEELEAIEKKARTEEAERHATERQERARFEFEQYQNKRFAEALALWPAERKQQLLTAFEQSPEFSRTRVLVAKGWDKAGVGAWIGLKTWMMTARADDLAELLPNPEDRTLPDWLAWRFEQTSPSARKA